MKDTYQLSPETKLDEYIQTSNQDFFVLQIGANDGKMADPIHNKVKMYKWSGLFVEPITYLYNRLRTNYNGCNNLKFENSVIAKHTGNIDFFQFPEELENNKEFPFWASGMGSVLEPFDSPGHKNVKSKNFEMVKKKTPCLTFTDLLNKHNVKHIDLLQIDTEGFDGEIICSIDFSRIRPKYIRYEEKHIQRVYDQNMTSVSSKDVVNHLTHHNYVIGDVLNGFDRVCVASEFL